MKSWKLYRFQLPTDYTRLRRNPPLIAGWPWHD
jgi:hypothetical protein